MLELPQTEEIEVAERHCGDCQHWHRIPPPPGIVDLKRREGLCRVHPPQYITIRPGVAQANYPQLVAETLACSLFKERHQENSNGESQDH